MRKIKATPTQARVLDALCEFGQTDLVARKLRISPRTVEVYVSRILAASGYPNRLTLVLAWDRARRKDDMDKD